MISVQNVSKRFELRSNPFSRILDPFRVANPSATAFWALRDISFNIDPGEVVAVIGPNGSGKSTLLQVISGILESTSGRVLRSGRVAALLELGAGFNPDFSGRENVYLSGEIMGLSGKDIDRVFSKIEAFAEIGSFMDRPVKQYSTGMYVRLAFSTAIHVEPEILIVDEALSVGDAIFAARCVRKFDELRQRNTTVLLVSHDLGLVKRLADRALFLLNGRIVLDSSPKAAVDRYIGFVLADGSDAPSRQQAVETSFRHGDGTSRIVAAKIAGQNGDATGNFHWGELISIVVVAEFSRWCESPVVGILIRNRAGIDVFGTNTRIEGCVMPACDSGDVLEVAFQIECLLARQEYTVTAATQHPDGLSQDWVNDLLDFRVVDIKEVAGMLRLATRIEHRRRPRSSAGVGLPTPAP